MGKAALEKRERWMRSFLQSVGFFLNIPLTMIGLTALAWGNCVPDGFAAFLLARQGSSQRKAQQDGSNGGGDSDGQGDVAEQDDASIGAGGVGGEAPGSAMAISGCFGAPIFNTMVVLSVRCLPCSDNPPCPALLCPALPWFALVCPVCHQLSIWTEYLLPCRVVLCRVVSYQVALLSEAVHLPGGGPVTEDVGLSALLFIGAENGIFF